MAYPIYTSDAGGMDDESQLSPELIQAMLSGLADPAESENLKAQQARAASLRQRSMSGEARSPWGVLAAGLQGYQGGKEARMAADAGAAMGQRREARGTEYMKALSNALRRRPNIPLETRPVTLESEYLNEDMP